MPLSSEEYFYFGKRSVSRLIAFVTIVYVLDLGKKTFIFVKYSVLSTQINIMIIE